MIHTPRHRPAPDKLLRQKAAWTARWNRICAGEANGLWATMAARKLLQSALHSFAYGKCAFCESLLGVTSYLQVEHYIAKTVDPDLTFEWTNLYPACGRCNNAKHDTDHGGLLLRPDVEDPEPFFWIHPDSGNLEPHPALDGRGRRRADETIKLLDLQRGPLCAKRIEMMGRVGRWVERLSACERTVPASLMAEWNELVDPRTEYKLVVRRVLELRGWPSLAVEDRKRFQTALGT